MPSKATSIIINSRPQTSSMETQNPSPNVDCSRPFRSVKEAVAIFGEQRLLIGFKTLHSPPPQQQQQQLSPSPRSLNELQIKNNVECEEVAERICSVDEQEEDEVKETHELKNLQAELAETKKELKLLKDRETEMEVAVAGLNAELHKTMSRLAMAEASAAAKAATPTRSLPVFLGGSSSSMNMISNRSPTVRATEDQIHRYPKLSEILSSGDQMSKKKMKTKKMKKQKPIVPLVGDLLSSPWKRKAYNNSNLY